MGQLDSNVQSPTTVGSLLASSRTRAVAPVRHVLRRAGFAGESERSTASMSAGRCGAGSSGVHVAALGKHKL
jgi:hypothetical protein